MSKRPNILLAVPIREGNHQITPDLGILYLGTALQTAGFKVTVLDCAKNRFSYGDFERFVRAGDYDAIGFRCYTRDHNYIKHHLKIVKSINPNIMTLIGGPHPSAIPEFVLQSMPHLDFAWKAEAEDGAPVLLDLYQEYGLAIPEDQLRTIPGLAWRSKAEERVIVNPASFGMDLDRYGIPAWEIMDPKSYPPFISKEYYPLVTTRGCPYPCTYCNTPNLSGRKLRHRSIDHVMEELRLLKRRYQIQHFSIVDDEFTLDWKYATALCEAMIEADLRLKWDCPVGVRLDSLRPDLLQTMEKAGCEALSVGIESGNERVQKLIKKKVTVEKIRERAFAIAGCSKIRITGCFMLGFLDETEEEIEDTVRFALELPLVRANFNIVIPIPGTAIFDEALRLGKLHLDKINFDVYTSEQIAFERDYVSAKRLLALQRNAYLRFFGRPRILKTLLKESLRNPEVIRGSLQKLRLLFSKQLISTGKSVPVPVYLLGADARPS
jgi:radical SAM superfamily enzyme YgiQ (UPF0313 family)